MELDVHYLIKIRDSSELTDSEQLPDWAAAALQRAPWVVVRRGHWIIDLIPVGIRGAIRSQRLASYLPRNCIVDVVSPEQLSKTKSWNSMDCTRLAHIREMLEQSSQLYDSLNIRWGPIGSLGFELTTGAPTLHATSDIDLIIYSQYPICRETMQQIYHFNKRFDIKLDVIIETNIGAVSLSEYIHSRSSVLFKTHNGPKLEYI